MSAAITVRGLSKRYYVQPVHRSHTVHEALAHGFARRTPAESLWALRDVDLDVERGSAIGLIGANGAGKSTLLRLLAKVGRPDTGTIVMRGHMCALLDLGTGFHSDLTGRENVHVAGVISGLTRAEVRQRFDSIVDFAGLDTFIDYPLRTYSTGMAMRLAFAVAIMVEPEILLVDEVLSVGDLAFQHKCAQRIHELRTNGTTLVFCSHQGELVTELCDIAAWLDGGRMRQVGPASDVVHAYEHSELALSE